MTPLWVGEPGIVSTGEGCESGRMPVTAKTAAGPAEGTPIHSLGYDMVNAGHPFAYPPGVGLMNVGFRLVSGTFSRLWCMVGSTLRTAHVQGLAYIT
jgi:hypothetical protein